jgi:PEP-CTERM motif
MFAYGKDSIMQTVPKLIRMLCSLTAVANLCSKAAVFYVNVTADLSAPSIFMTVNNVTEVVLPLADRPSSAFGSGDTLNVSIGFESGRRLGLTANPTGQSAPLGQEGIGLLVSDSTIPYSVYGQLESYVSLTDPTGAYFTDSASAIVGFGSTQGAITRLVTDWTDTTFSVAGFTFLMDIDQISQPVVPNELILEFREFQVQAIPEPATYGLLLAAVGVLSFARRRASRPRNRP